MKKATATVVTLFYCLFITLTCLAQQNDSVWNILVKNFQNWSRQRPSAGPYLSTDKKIYLPNETIWMTAFLFEEESGDRMADSVLNANVLYTVLIDPLRKKPVLSDRFPINNKFGKGGLNLPDSLVPGEYILLAYTNRYLQDKNELIYSQPVSIRSPKADPFKLKLQYSISAEGSIDTGYIKYSVDTSKSSLAVGGVIHYTLYANGTPFDSGSNRLDAGGRSLVKYMVVPGIMQKNIELRTTIKKGSISNTFTESIVTASLSGRDSILSNVVVPQDDMMDIIKNEAQDSIYVYIHSSHLAQGGIVMLSDKKHIYFGASIILKGDHGFVKLPLASLSRGIIHLSLFTAAGCYLTERAVWLPPHQYTVSMHPVDSILADNPILNTRSFTEWEISITDENKQPVEAAFSLSCVLSKRLGARAPDIRKYFYFDRFLPDSARLPASWNYETVVRQTNDHPTAPWLVCINGHTDSVPRWMGPFAPVYGQVERKSRQVKLPVRLALVNDGPLLKFHTDSNGHFQLFPDMLKGTQGTTVTIFVDEKDQEEYKIIINERDLLANRELASTYYTPPERDGDIFTEEENTAMKAMLQEVVVRAKNRDTYYAMPRVVDTTCSAWVCNCDHWMCNGCLPVKKPIPGRMYFNKRKQDFFIYKGCPDDLVTPFMARIKTISLPPKFYIKDSVALTAPDLQLASTLYWDHLVTTDKDGKARFSFYTNDLTGRFACVLQGVTEEGVINARQYFSVQNINVLTKNKP